MDYLISRMLCSFITGVILSQTGSLTQMGTRNILAGPSTLGFDGLAILWVLIFHSIFIFLGVENYSINVLVLMGIPFFIALGFPFSRLVRGKEKYDRIVLLGLTFNFLVGALFSLWQFLFLAFNLPFPIELWFGHFRFVTADLAYYLITVEALILFGLWHLRKELLLFSLGPGISKNWNLKEQKLYFFIFGAVALGTFVIVSLFGTFSFLALIFPIISRRVWLKKYGLTGEILVGAIVNGFVLMGIDSLCYFFPVMGAEIPVGLIVIGVGALSLLFLLWKSQDKGNSGKS